MPNFANVTVLRLMHLSEHAILITFLGIHEKKADYLIFYVLNGVAKLAQSHQGLFGCRF